MLSKLGAGAFSTVWLCADEKDPDRQLVAMKVHGFPESCFMAGLQVEEERNGTGVMQNMIGLLILIH